MVNPRVQGVRPLDHYRLEIVFSNGETGVYDCRPLLEFGVFVELKDPRYFGQVRAELGRVVWPHEQDMCPGTLYRDSEKRACKFTANRLISHHDPEGD